MLLTDRYASAVHSTNLRSRSTTTYGDADVLGAAGLAAKRNPLAIGLQRLLAGDNHATREIVGHMSSMLVGKAWHGAKQQLPRTVAQDMARATLAWCRNGTCKVCSGHGFQLIPGTPSLSSDQCGTCRGSGKRQLLREFPMMHQWLVQWLVAEVEREMAKAAPEMMKSLADRMASA